MKSGAIVLLLKYKKINKGDVSFFVFHNAKKDLDKLACVAKDCGTKYVKSGALPYEQ
ncbi:UNVERIFIED_CONTAM: hypothetical protein HDU68_008161, partial [Siphonaria sp. JEL0065]